MLLRQGSRISFQQHFAARQKQHPIANLRHFVHVVRGPQNAAVIRRGEALDFSADQLCRGRIQRGRGFIEQQQLRMIEQRLGERSPSLLAGGQ